MHATELSDLIRHYQAICNAVPLYPIHSAAEYDWAVSILNELLDAGGADENNPLARLVETLGLFIHEYEKVHYPLEESTH
jgi:HTH-type transcriptional regulator/antitoxin HigA